MGKKVKRGQVELNPMGIKTISDHEIKIILRGADDLIMSGGRTMLAKILAGSKDQRILERGMEHSPVYGAFQGTSQKEILAMVDWMIIHDYLAIEYDFGIPLLVYTDKGWEIERETYTEELFIKLLEAAEYQEYEFVETLKDLDRRMIFLLLDKIADSGNKDFIVILNAWHSFEYKKVKSRIEEVIEVLEQAKGDINKKPKEETISFSANKKWLSIPAETRKSLERNVWCSNCCDVVQIENYTVKESKYGIVLHGTCKTCGHEVARVID
ncbi:RQC domain-containing protein [Neobacillus mesonae]|uniref:RQC domain-containing protein n=1 Tax=Neobacillus mesonae TaxID=1193713 RepID=UPI00082A9611|nr:RQC-minor-1 family DNA-binding protein [Neobacillus mesonae]